MFFLQEVFPNGFLLDEKYFNYFFNWKNIAKLIKTLKVLISFLLLSHPSKINWYTYCIVLNYNNEVENYV